LILRVLQFSYNYQFGFTSRAGYLELFRLRILGKKVHGQYAENKNAESLRAWKSRRNAQKPNLTKRSPFGFRRFFLGVKVFGERCGHGGKMQFSNNSFSWSKNGIFYALFCVLPDLYFVPTDGYTLHGKFSAYQNLIDPIQISNQFAALHYFLHELLQNCRHFPLSNRNALFEMVQLKSLLCHHYHSESGGHSANYYAFRNNHLFVLLSNHKVQNFLNLPFETHVELVENWRPSNCPKIFPDLRSNLVHFPLLNDLLPFDSQFAQNLSLALMHCL